MLHTFFMKLRPSTQRELEEVPVLTEEILIKRRESFDFHTPYEHEIYLLDIVRSGDIKRLDESSARRASGSPGVLSKDPLRNRKNLLIASVATVTRAAMDGGVPEEVAYAMSDSFIRKSEDALDVQTVDALNTRAIRDFTLAVASYKKKKIASSRARQCIDYIQKYLYQNIQLSLLAEELHISCSTVSRIFSNEIGVSFVEYVQRERVEAAKKMLKFTSLSMLEISSMLCFATQSYFIKIFKKHTAQTPAQFIQGKD